jgi:diacylglycerol kinase family enzyme
VLSHAFPNVPGVKRVIARSFEVRTRHRKRIYADGEFVTCTPAWFSVLPHALPVVVPRAAGSAFVAPEPAGDVGATA